MDDEDAAQAGTAATPAQRVESVLPAEMVVPEVEPTGHPDVDAALDRLRELGEQPTGAHADLYDGVHQRLQDVLAQIDQR
jgi:hypothetical protein